jgi:hypothetical protein
MDNPWRRARSRSASPAPTNRRPDRERSPVPSTSQETITPSDSVSNISRRIPDIIYKTWEKQPRTGARTKWSPIYEYYESINLVGEVYYKREDKAKKTPYEDVLRICTHCQEKGKTTQSTDSSRFGSTSNLWTHLKTAHKIYPDGKSAPTSDTSQTTLDSHGVTSKKGTEPATTMTLDKAIIEWIIDT